MRAGDSIEALAQRHRLPVEYIRDTLEKCKVNRQREDAPKRPKHEH